MSSAATAVLALSDLPDVWLNSRTIQNACDFHDISTMKIAGVLCSKIIKIYISYSRFNFFRRKYSVRINSTTLIQRFKIMLGTHRLETVGKVLEYSYTVIDILLSIPIPQMTDIILVQIAMTIYARKLYATLCALALPPIAIAA